jgi:hypothetical protein
MIDCIYFVNMIMRKIIIFVYLKSFVRKFVYFILKKLYNRSFYLPFDGLFFAQVI